MAEVLTTALDHQNPEVIDLHRQGMQMVLTLKMALVHVSISHTQVSCIAIVFELLLGKLRNRTKILGLML
jgi:phosphopantetheinyl transferase (holo-ACP synthase)